MGKVLVLAAGVLSIPGLVAVPMLMEAPTGATVLLHGLAFAAAGLALALTRHRAQADTPGGLQLLVLAIAVAAPLYTLGASSGPEGYSLALSGMTGGSRYLAGVAWPLVVLALWLRRGRVASRLDEVPVPGLSCLCISTIYAFTIYMRGSLSALDAPVFLVLFAIYIWRSSTPRGPLGHVQGPRAGGGPGWPAMAVLVCAAAGVSLALAGGLLAWAQWPVVLAVAGVALAWRARDGTVASMVLAVHVALWTLLLALISSAGLTDGLAQIELDERQKSEFLLALSQALFTVVLLSRLRVSWKGGLAMVALFAAEAALGLLPPAEVSHWRNLFAVLYLCMAAALVVQDRARLYTLAGMAPPGAGRPAHQAEPMGRDVGH